eukprot:6132140-Prymnesium_polylepis.2
MAHESQLDEAFACNTTTFEPIDGPFVNKTVVQCKTYSLDAQGHGFFCAPHVPPYSCLGRTGLQVLDTLRLTFSTIMSKDPVVGDAMWYSYVGLAFVIGLFWKVLYLVAVNVIPAQYSHFALCRTLPLNPRRSLPRVPCRMNAPRRSSTVRRRLSRMSRTPGSTAPACRART